MGLFDAVVQGVRERAKRRDVPRLQKAMDMHEFQGYLRNAGRSHSTRDLAALTGVSQSTVSNQIAIAESLSHPVLARSGVTPDDLAHLSYSELLRIAKLPLYLRDAPLRQAARGLESTVSAAPAGLHSVGLPKVREERRAAAYRRMREEGDFRVEITKPVAELTTKEASEYLDDFLPAVANMAEILLGNTKTYYIGVTGNGGILVYLGPAGR